MEGKFENLQCRVSGRVDALVSVVVSQLLDREPSWPEHRVEFLPNRTRTSDGNPILVSQCGKTQKKTSRLHVSHSKTNTQAKRRPGSSIAELPLTLGPETPATLLTC